MDGSAKVQAVDTFSIAFVEHVPLPETLQEQQALLRNDVFLHRMKPLVRVNLQARAMDGKNNGNPCMNFRAVCTLCRNQAGSYVAMVKWWVAGPKKDSSQIRCKGAHSHASETHSEVL